MTKTDNSITGTDWKLFEIEEWVGISLKQPTRNSKSRWIPISVDNIKFNTWHTKGRTPQETALILDSHQPVLKLFAIHKDKVADYPTDSMRAVTERYAVAKYGQRTLDEVVKTANRVKNWNMADGVW